MTAPTIVGSEEGSLLDDVDVEFGSVEAEAAAARAPVDPNTLPLVLVLIGRVGAGKSSTANTLVGQLVEPFTTRHSASAVTAACRAEHAEIDGQRVIVLDTPGLGDAATPEEEVLNEIRRGVKELTPTGAAMCILWVMSLNSRVGEEEHAAIAYLEQKLFGMKMLESTVVVWTHADSLDGSGLAGFLQGAEDRLRDLLSKVGGSSVTIDNRQIHKVGDGAPTEVHEIFRQAKAASRQYLVIKPRQDRAFGRKSARRKRQMEAGLLHRPNGPSPPGQSNCALM